MDKYRIKNQATSQSKYTRYFSKEFKRAKVKELEQKQITISKLVTLYGVCRQTVYNWLYQYSAHYKQGTRLVVEPESESKKTERLLKRVCELEQVIGQKQLEIDYLNKLIEVSSDELSVDIKKIMKVNNLKGSRVDQIPITEDLFFHLSEITLPKDGYIFPFLNYNKLKTSWRRCMQALNFKYNMHQLRKTRGTKLPEAGINPFYLKQFMRHESLKTTERYYIFVNINKAR